MAPDPARAGANRPGPVATPVPPQFTARLRTLEPSFEANRGQFPPAVRYGARAAGYLCLLTDSGPILSVAAANSGPGGSDLAGRERTGRSAARPIADSALVRLRFGGGRPHPVVTGEAALPGTVNVFEGRDPSRWITRIPTYSRVRFHELYPGIDLLFYFNGQQIEFDFVVEPGADPAAIKMALRGGTSLAIEDGDLVCSTRNGAFRLHGPTLLEGGSKQGRMLTGGFALRDTGEIGFQVRGHDPSQRLVVDPVLEYSSYLEGAGGAEPFGVASDSAGNTYVAGWASSSQNALVSKLRPDGAVAFSTYLGGPVTQARAVAVDQQGGIYVTGWTSSSQFPTTAGVIQPTHNPTACGSGDSLCADAFLAKLSATGSDLVYSTFLGGDLDDRSESIAVDARGYAVIAGETASRNFPTVNPFQANFGGGDHDAFVARLDPGAMRLTFSTYLGGSQSDDARGVSYDSAGDVLVAGFTASADFPLRNPKPTPAGPLKGFLTRLSGDGSVLYSTLFGGSGTDTITGLAADSTGGVYLCGLAGSADFPIVGGLPGAGGAAFAAKLDVQSLAIGFSTRLGTRAGAQAIAVDPSGVVVGGSTMWADLPLVNPIQSVIVGSYDAFVAKLRPDGAALTFSTYLGGSSDDGLAGVAIDGSGRIHLAGNTTSCDFPITHASQTLCSSAWVAMIGAGNDGGLTVAATGSPTSGPAPLATTFAASCAGGSPPYAYDWDFADGSSHSGLQNPGRIYASPGAYVAQLVARDAAGATARASVVVTATQGPPCTLSCAASAPLVGRTGTAVAFQGSAVASDGCGTQPGFTWTFDDGGTASGPSTSHAFDHAGVHTWWLAVAGGGETCNRTGVITVREGATSGVYLIPAVAHKPGYHETQWRTDVSAVEPDFLPSGATLVYLSDNETLARDVVFSESGLLEWQDILASLFGLTPNAASSGTLQVFSDRPLALTSRTYNQTPEGTLGSSFPGVGPDDVRLSGRSGTLPGVKKNGDYRTNVGAINVGESECTVTFNLLGSRPNLILGQATVTLPAGRWRQVDDIFAAVGAAPADLAYVAVAGSCTLWAYASVVDNHTGSPMTIPIVFSP